MAVPVGGGDVETTNSSLSENDTAVPLPASVTAAGLGGADSIDGQTEHEGAVQTSGSNIELSTELGLLPDQKGVYEVVHEYEIPSRVHRLEVSIQEDATVTTIEGFVRSSESERTYRWDRSTETPRLEYEKQANQSINQTGPIAGPGRFIFVDVGDWALVSQPRLSHSWGWMGERVGFDRTVTAREGVASDVMAYLGEYEKYTHEAHGQTFRLVVPEAASLAEDREALFDSLADGADTLRVGDRDEEVFMVAAPTGVVNWGVRGLQTGPADMWARDNERLADPDNVWLHEYIHTRQDYWPTEDLRWLIEGSATYYTALLTLEQEHISFEEFREHIESGTRDRHSGSILAQPDTWQRGADYYVGALVTGELDRQIRQATDREHSFQDVFRQLNEKAEVSVTDFEQFLRDAGGQEVAALGEQYTRTTDRPQMWTRQQHDEAFDATPARITVGFADTGPLRVSGNYRDRTLNPDRPVDIVTGETLTLDTVARNLGGTVGEYNATLWVNSVRQSSQTGMLDPDASTTLQFEHTFETVGEYEISVGDAGVPVSVRQPAPARVTAFEANRTDVRPGTSIGLSATVENNASYPGERDLSLVRDGDTVDTRTVRLDAESEQTVEFDVTLEEAGTYVFHLDGSSTGPVVVTATDAETETSADDESSDSVELDDGSDDSAATDGDADDSGAVGWVGIAVAALVVLAGIGFWRLHTQTAGNEANSEKL